MNKLLKNLSVFFVCLNLFISKVYAIDCTNYDISKLSNLIVIVPFISLIISAFLWYRYGRDDKPIETVEFYPPQGYNSLEIGYLYKGRADSKDVVSLLIYLANKGYIKIEETETKILFNNSKGFTVTKLKEYDGKNEYEKEFLKGLFLNANVSYMDFKRIKKMMQDAQDNGENLAYEEALENLRTRKEENPYEVSVSSGQLLNNFYVTVDNILKKINTRKDGKVPFNSNVEKPSLVVLFLAIISFVTVIAVPTLDYGNVSSLLVTILIVCIFMCSYLEYIRIKDLASFILAIIILSCLCIALLYMPFGSAVITNATYRIYSIIGIICAIFTMLFYHYMPQRTDEGTKLLGKIKGFKNYLTTCGKDKLERMLVDNPNYFYDILPYAYVLGVSDKWIKGFGDLLTEPPTWSDETEQFDRALITNFIKSTFFVAEKTMTSKQKKYRNIFYTHQSGSRSDSHGEK